MLRIWGQAAHCITREREARMSDRKRDYAALQQQLVFIRSAYRRGELSQAAYQANRRIILGELLGHRRFWRDAAAHAVHLATKRAKRKRT